MTHDAAMNFFFEQAVDRLYQKQPVQPTENRVGENCWIARIGYAILCTMKKND
jgi:hypothetical protein